MTYKRYNSIQEAISEHLIIKENGCIEWSGCLDSYGYGVFGFNKKTRKAHREAYKLKYGSIPKGKIICHTCNNRKCINPDHLYAGTWKSNADDCTNSGNRKCGEDSSFSKLKEKDVIDILHKYHTDKYLQKDIAKFYDVSRFCIMRIINKQSWKHININN